MTSGARAVLCLVAVASLCGCMVNGEESNEPMMRPTEDAGPMGRDGGMLGMMGGDAGRMPPKLELDPLPEVTQFASVPLTGRGPANGTVIIDTPARGSITAMVSAAGTFCVDIPLRPDSENELTLQAIDAMGTYSEMVTTKTRQMGRPPEPEMVTPEEPKNVGLDATLVATTTDVEEGDWWALSDGDTSTSVKVSNTRWDDDWFSLQLSERANIGSVHVTSVGDCALSEYYVFLSDTDPPPPATRANGMQWREVAHVRGGTGDDTLTFDPMIARYVGIEFISGDCTDWGLGYHQISEIEVWTRPLPPPPPRTVEAPSCLSADLGRNAPMH